MVKILQHIPRYLPDLVAGLNHVYARIHAVLHLDGQNACVAVKILSLALEAIETVCILQVKCCDTSHVLISFTFDWFVLLLLESLTIRIAFLTANVRHVYFSCKQIFSMLL